MGFCAEQIERVQPLWDQLLDLRLLRRGTVGLPVLRRWVQLNVMFFKALVPFVATLIPKAPEEQWVLLWQLIAAFEEEMRLFREWGARLSLERGEVRPALTQHSYLRFLIPSAYLGTYEEGLAILYVAGKTYMTPRAGAVHDGTPAHEAAAADRRPASGRVPLAAALRDLEAHIDALAERLGPPGCAAMAQSFDEAACYEAQFWKVALTDEDPSWEEVQGVLV